MFKKIVGCIATICTAEDFNNVCGMINTAFQQDKISWKERNLLHAVMEKIRV